MSEAATPKSRARRVKIAVSALASIVAAPAIALAVVVNRTWFELHLTQSFCAADARQLHRLTAVRIVSIVFAAFILGIAAPLLTKWLSSRTTRAALVSFSRFALAVGLALVVSALILRARRAPEPVLSAPALPPLHPDPEMGWVGDANIDVSLRADDRDIPYSFDSMGYRGPTQADPDFGVPAILFAGESITEGVGVRWEEAFPARVAADLHVAPIEAAVHGYGNAQIRWETQKILPKIAHPLAVVTLMIPQLLERDLDVTRPHLVIGAQNELLRMAPEPPEPDWWKNFPLRKVAHGLFPYHDDSAIALARAIFLATKKDVEARGAFPLFVITNWGAPCLPPDPGTPTLDERLFGGLDLHWIDVTLDPNDQEHSTYHPNAKAHGVLADAIEKALVDAKVASR